LYASSKSGDTFVAGWHGWPLVIWGEPWTINMPLTITARLMLVALYTSGFIIALEQFMSHGLQNF
jgi:hypothetical protein